MEIVRTVSSWIRNKTLQSFIRRLYHLQNGSVAVIVALSMTALLGFSALVLDLGVSYNEASKLQNALDSAALAAVRELPSENLTSTSWASAKKKAIEYAAANGVVLVQEDIAPIYKDNISANRIIGIKLTKSIKVDYSFARVLGIQSGTLTRTASAGVKPAGAVVGAIPLSISESSLLAAINANATAGLTIKCSPNVEDISIDCENLTGWFGALRFEGSGASVYTELLSYGYEGAIYVGQVLDMESGNMSGPTLDGFTTRYNACTHGCTATCFVPGCPRVVYIPVVEVLPFNQVKVVSFAPFFLLECGGSGLNSYIKATYLKNVVVPSAASGASGTDFGLYVRKLLN